MWLDAARDFKMNIDFDVERVCEADTLDFGDMMAAMKVSSADKLTIQALGDKIILSRMCNNLDIPQMPLLMAVQDPTAVRDEVEALVDSCLLQPDAYDVILKPTHLSNGEGVMSVSAVTQEQRDATVDVIESHIQQFLNKQASELESQALQSVVPGYMAQAKYKSTVCFPMPLELRVTALWGRVRVGVWWWGGVAPERNTWFVRRPLKQGAFSDEDNWEALHEHSGCNTGFDVAITLFLRHMSSMVAMTEHLAKALGAPFFRADFFVGNPEFGVRLNEVAYGSGIDYKRTDAGSGALVNDSTAIAQILQEGMQRCSQRFPAETFLTSLGLRGPIYAEAMVDEIRASQRVELPQGARWKHTDPSALEFSVSPEDCETPQHCHLGAPVMSISDSLSLRQELTDGAGCMGNPWPLLNPMSWVADLDCKPSPSRVQNSPGLPRRTYTSDFSTDMEDKAQGCIGGHWLLNSMPMWMSVLAKANFHQTPIQRAKAKCGLVML